MCSSPTKPLKTALLLLAAVSFATIALGEELTPAHFMPPTHTLHQEAEIQRLAQQGAVVDAIYRALIE